MMQWIQTVVTENITLPQTTYIGSNNVIQANGDQCRSRSRCIALKHLTLKHLTLMACSHQAESESKKDKIK